MPDKLTEHERKIIERAVAEKRITPCPVGAITESLHGRPWMQQRESAFRIAVRKRRFEAAEIKRERSARQQAARALKGREVAAGE